MKKFAHIIIWLILHMYAFFILFISVCVLSFCIFSSIPFRCFKIVLSFSVIILGLWYHLHFNPSSQFTTIIHEFGHLFHLNLCCYRYNPKEVYDCSIAYNTLSIKSPEIVGNSFCSIYLGLESHKPQSHFY